VGGRPFPLVHSAANCSQAPRTSSQPTSRPPTGCIVVTVALCDQISAIELASPVTMRLSAA
jgi:hypothetical protein